MPKPKLKKPILRNVFPKKVGVNRKGVNLSSLPELMKERNRIITDFLKGPESKLFKKVNAFAKKIGKENLGELEISSILEKQFNEYPSMKEDVRLYLKYDFMIRSLKKHSVNK